MAKSVPPPASTAEDDFSAAFAEFAEPERKTPAESQPAQAAKKSAEPAEIVESPPEPAPAEVVESPPELPEPAPEPPAAAAPEKVEEPPPEPAKPDNEDLLRRFAEIVRTQAPPPQFAPPAAPEPELYSAEERQLLASYEKEWPDVFRAEALRRRAEYRDIVGYVFNQIQPHLQQLASTVSLLSERTQLHDLNSVVADYADVRDKVISWAQKQPPYLQAAYNNVINAGTVDEVRDLIDRYRRETGAPGRAAKPPAELPPAIKQAAAALAPVNSKRSGVIQADDLNDFDSAFANFAKTMS
jgi:hypothetical protein